MQIIENPHEVAKIEGHTKQPLDAQEVILRAVSLLKNTINEKWLAVPEQVDKENVPQNVLPALKAPQMKQGPEIADPDKAYVRSRIITALAPWPIAHAAPRS